MTTTSDLPDVTALRADELEVALRRHALRVGPTVRAAVNLLIDDGRWLRREEFLRAAASYFPEQAVVSVSWVQAEKFLQDAQGSTNELTILKVAVALGLDTFNFSAMGPQSGVPIMTAIARAFGHNA